MAKKTTAKKTTAKKTTVKKQTAKKKTSKKKTAKRTKAQAETYPLRITAAQCETLGYRARIKPKLKKKIKEAANYHHHVQLTRDEMLYLYDVLCDFAPYIYEEDEELFNLLQLLMLRLDEIYGPAEVAEPEIAPPAGKKKAKTAEQLYQFKITLLGGTPEIWRRIQVRDCDLSRLHEYIQAAFGWQNCHMHQFKIEGHTYAPQFDGPLMFDMATEDEKKFRLSQLVPKSARPGRWLYEYDFGDDWVHGIEFEGHVDAAPREKYPRCIDGARACPPEDCGGVGGYSHLLQVLADPDDPEYEEVLEWHGEIDPEEFSLPGTNKALQAAHKTLRR